MYYNVIITRLFFVDAEYYTLSVDLKQRRKPMGAADTTGAEEDTMVAEEDTVAVEEDTEVEEVTEAVEVDTEAVEADTADVEATEGGRAEEATEASVVGAEATEETKVATNVPMEAETQELSHC